MKKTVLIVGANGQLGHCLKDLMPTHINPLYTDIQELDITNRLAVEAFFNAHNIDVCINASAYTQVDKAETERVLAYEINAQGVANLATSCHSHNAIFIHVSTDYVFDGAQNRPYTEQDDAYPLNVYGQTKLEGERLALECCPNTYILRTSWLYSPYGQNFVKTMIRLMGERSELSVVNDQMGSPTSAHDLTKIILQIIDSPIDFGLYHFSNLGDISWYDFAKAIAQIKGFTTQIKGIPSSEYPTPALRAQYSVMSKSKIQKALNTTIPEWEDALKIVLDQL